jgi:hypothetical protein
MTKLTIKQMKETRGGLASCQWFYWDNMNCFVCNGGCYICGDGEQDWMDDSTCP